MRARRDVSLWQDISNRWRAIASVARRRTADVPKTMDWQLGLAEVLLTKADQVCPKCGRQLELALQPDGHPPRTFQCFSCDRPDPLKLTRFRSWTKGKLHAPE
jgi:hypothetical protein